MRRINHKSLGIKFLLDPVYLSNVGGGLRKKMWVSSPNYVYNVIIALR